MILNLAAALAVMLVLAGGMAGLAGVIGTTRPPGPPSQLTQRARRWWTGTGRTRRDQRARQVQLVTAAVAGAAAWLLTGWPAAGLIIGLAVPGIPWLLSAGRVEQRAIAKLQAVEDWTRRLADIVARGLGLQQSVVATAETAPHLIETEVRDLAARIQASGDPATALRRFADELDDYTVDQVIAPLLLSLTDRGPGLQGILTDISRSIKAEIETRSTVNAKRAGPRFAVRFLTWFTVALLAYGAVNPAYIEPYGTPLGQAVLITLAVVYVVLMMYVRKLSLPPARERLLPPAAGAGEAVA